MAAYCALRLPDFIKNNQAFRDGHYEKALEECFISFDSKIIERSVVEELKKLAGCQEAEEEEQEEQDTTNEVSNLCEEASMPIEAVIAKLAGGEVGGPEGQGAGSAPMNPALRKLKEKDQKPVSPFLRAKPSPLGEQGGSNNKHIHFNEDGSEAGGDKTKEEIKTEDELTANKEASPATPVNGKVTDEEASESVENSPEGSEKENKDTNGAVVAVNGAGEVTDAEGNLIKGKGKGKGKGKSRGKSEDGAGLVVEKKKAKKSATEIYETMLKTSPEDGDEESEDSEDEEFGEGLEEADSDEDGEEDAEDEEDSDDESEEDDEEGEEEEDEEEDVPEAEFTEEPGNDSGCTAVVALLAGTKLYVANAGDSR